MDSPTLIAIALGLAIDAFSVSVATGISGNTHKSNSRNQAFKMAFSFGSFQAFMPLLGWAAGINLLGLISEVDHWLAFGLLFLVGCKMIYEGAKPESQGKEINLSFCTLLVLSVATSIDALAVGLSFAFLKISIAIPIMVIGAITFTLSFIGTTLGSKIKGFSSNKIEIVGGIILIGIGIKILLEHLS